MSGVGRFYEGSQKVTGLTANSRDRLRQVAYYLIPFTVSLMVCVCVGVFVKPIPIVHDEFSYILLGETIASGRLANPAHEFKEYFETLHVLSSPTYGSKYFPAQGLLIALGICLGNPFIGIWLSYAVATVCVVWGLESFLDRTQAFFGGLLFGLHPSLVYYWGNSYWGGAIPVLFGALATGAAFRIVGGVNGDFRRLAQMGLVFGIGGGGLVLSRPYEGFVLCGALGIIMLWEFYREKLRLVRLFGVGVVVAVPVLFSIFLLGLYNSKVTGSLFVTPYQQYESNYSQTPIFIFQQQRVDSTLKYPDKRFRDFDMNIQGAYYHSVRSQNGLLSSLGRKFSIYHKYLIGWSVSLALVIGLMYAVGDFVRWSVVMLFGAMALAVSTYVQVHYAAPFFPLVWGASVAGLSWLFRRRVWMLKLSAIVVVLVFLFEHSSYSYESFQRQRKTALYLRPRIEALLRLDPHHDVVFVRYGESHDPNNEWVFNGADIDGSDIVWARELNHMRNVRLMEYYSTRISWMLDADSMELRCLGIGGEKSQIPPIYQEYGNWRRMK